MAGPAISPSGALLPALLVQGASARPAHGKAQMRHVAPASSVAAAVEAVPAKAAVQPDSKVQRKLQVYRLLEDWDRFK